MKRLLICLVLLATSSAVSAQALREDLWVTNGRVHATAVLGNTLYLGGEFSRVGPATGGLMPVHVTGAAPLLPPLRVDGTIRAMQADGLGGWYVGGSFRHIQGVARNGLARITATGVVLPWSPGVNGTVEAMLLNAGTIYLGGTFSTVAGQTRNNLAAIVASTGALVPDWNPNANATVYAIGFATNRVYIGGAFTNVAGVTRLHAASLDAVTGAALTWQPNPDGDVYALVPVYDVMNLTTYVYLGGSFANVFGFPRTNFAHVDATVGSPTFNQPTSFNPAPDGPVRALVVSGRLVITTYMGGDFANAGGQPRSRLAAFNGTNVTSWNPGADGTVVSLRLVGTTMYVGGYFGQLGGQPRPFAGQVATSGGAATAWDPRPNAPVRVFATADTTVWMGGDFTSLGGVARANLAALDLATGQATAWNPGTNGKVYALEQIGGLLYAGGAFTTVGGQSRPRVAQLDAAGNLGGWNPAPDGTVRAIGWRSGLNVNTIFLGGEFANVMGTPRNRLAAVSDAVMPALSSWNPDANGRVDAIVTDPNWVYVGGEFTGFAGLYTRQFVAQLDPNGVPSGFFPLSSKPIKALAKVGSTLYLGFSGQATIGGAQRRGVAAFAPPTNTPLPWDPQCDGSVYTILPSGGTIRLGGFFSSMGGQPRENLAAVDTAQAAGVTSFNAPTWSFQNVFLLGADLPGVFDLIEAGGTLYAAGGFTSILYEPHSAIAGLVPPTVDVAPPPANALALRAMPNPAHATQTLAFTLPESGPVALAIHDVAGRRVRTLDPGVLAAGPHRVAWDGRRDDGARAAAGVYFVSLATATERARAKLLRLEP